MSPFWATRSGQDSRPWEEDRETGGSKKDLLGGGLGCGADRLFASQPSSHFDLRHCLAQTGPPVLGDVSGEGTQWANETFTVSKKRANMAKCQQQFGLGGGYKDLYCALSGVPAGRGRPSSWSLLTCVWAPPLVWLLSLVGTCSP